MYKNKNIFYFALKAYFYAEKWERSHNMIFEFLDILRAVLKINRKTTIIYINLKGMR